VAPHYNSHAFSITSLNASVNFFSQTNFDFERLNWLTSICFSFCEFWYESYLDYFKLQSA
jgi:hypothetical protein